MDTFRELRPYVYHVTARENLASLAATMSLEPAATLLRWSGRIDLLRCRRSEAVTLHCGTQTIVLKDQAPLIEKNVELGHGWAFGDFVEYLNEHVFFWPGTVTGPIRSGARLHDHYESTAPLLLRIPTAELLDANRSGIPLFCPFNSGAPRQQNGRRVTRGADLFAVAADFPRRESEVVELAFRSNVEMPPETCVRDAEEWRSLASYAA